MQPLPDTSNASIAAAVARIRSWRQIKGIPASRFARDAGLSETVTRDIDDEAWNPTRATLAKLETLIPDGWQAGEPIPDGGAAASSATASEGQAAR